MDVLGWEMGGWKLADLYIIERGTEEGAEECEYVKYSREWQRRDAICSRWLRLCNRKILSMFMFIEDGRGRMKKRLLAKDTLGDRHNTS